MKVNEIANKALEEYPFIFSNPVGTAIVGGKQFYAKKAGAIPVKKGDRITIGGQNITFGLYPGSSDYVGWNEIIITPEMIGQKIAVFTSIEIKTENDKLSKKQRTWNRIVRQAGGIVEAWHAIGDKIERLKGEEIE